MSTLIRPELSEKNRYWIERHRYYELKHFCLQYPIWRKAREQLISLSHRPIDLALFSNEVNDSTERCAEARLYYTDRMRMIEQVAEETDYVLANYILRAVTEGISYELLNARYGIPCSKDYYYELYRRFFWLLNKARK